MRIELYGIARSRAGIEAIDLEATTFAEAIRGLGQHCPSLVGEVIAGGRLADGFLAALNGQRFLGDAATPLAAGDVLVIVGAEAGG